MPTVNNPYVNPVDLANTAPKYHASQHSKGGFDPLTPADIGAAPADHSHDTPVSVAWDNVTGKPAKFSPSVHAATHGSDGGDPIALDASQIVSGVVPLERLPHGCLERLVIVANDEARFALTTAQVQQGDTVKVESTQMMYFVVDESKLNSPDGYVAYTAGAASAVDWSAVTGKPETYPPSAHTHMAAQITDFDSAVDARLSALGISAASMLPAGFAKQETTVNFRASSVSFTRDGPSDVYLDMGQINGYSTGITIPFDLYINGRTSVHVELLSGDTVVWDGGSLGGYDTERYNADIPIGTYLTDLRFHISGMSSNGSLSISDWFVRIVRLVAG